MAGLNQPQLGSNLSGAFPSAGFNQNAANVAAGNSIGSAVSGAISSFGNFAKTAQVPGQSFNTNPTSQTPMLPGLGGGPVPTPTGGTVMPKQVAAGITAPVHPPAPQPDAPSNPGLASFLTTQYPTPNGGKVTLDSSGGVSNYTPASQFSIDTSGAVPSSALTSNTSMNDISQQHGQYQDYVNALAQAQGYSPQYQQAYQQSQQAQANQAGVATGLVSRGAPTLQGYLQNPSSFGDTSGYAQALNGQEQALASQQQTQANIALNTQQLARTGNIAAAQTMLQSSPAGMAGQNAINQYNTLQQSYPGANIPEYNTALTPEQNQQIANYIVSNSPAYKAGFQSTYQTPGGGTGIYSKLDVGSGGLSKNQDGSYTLVPAAAAALGTANASVVNNSLSNLSTINAAIDSSTKTLESTTQFMNQNGLNQSDVPILTQIQNKFKDQTTQRGYISGLNADLNTLRSDYSQFLIGRGGSVAGTGANSPEVMQAIPDNISPAQLKTLVGQMQQDGQNTADAVSTQVNNALQGLRTGQAPSTNSQTTGGSLWSF